MPDPTLNLLQSGVEILLRGDDGTKQWIAPNHGKYPVAHLSTFRNQYTSLARVYRDYDEALVDNRDNARFMWNDVGIRECVDARKRSVALLNWHLEPEDEKSDDQRAFCAKLEKIIRRIRHLTEYRYVTQNAIWLGKMGIQHRWTAQVVDKQSVWMPYGLHQDDWGWIPLHGDKLVFRQSRPENTPGAYSGQMGIRVGWQNWEPGDIINNRWKVESTDYGLAYFLSPAERRLMLVHKHHVEDAPYEDGLRAGSIHGVGIRSVIYWEWVQKQETMAFLMEFLERMAGGIQIWKYPQGNPQALAEARTAAENFNAGQEHIMLVPVPIGENGSQYGVDIVDPGFQGIEAIQTLVKDFFSDRIKRYILGQKLSSEAEATGMGSGVAELHMDTLLQIIRSDATSHEETMTSELVDTIIKINVQKNVFMEPGFRPRFVVETEEADVDKKLEAWAMLIDRGMKFRAKDLYELVGAAMPNPDDEVNPDLPDKGGKDAAGGEGSPDHPIDPKMAMADGPKKDSIEPDKNAGSGPSEDHVERYQRIIAERFGRAFYKPTKFVSSNGSRS